MGQFRIIENSSFLTTRLRGIEILLWYARINNTFLSFHSLLPCSKVWPKKGPNINKKIWKEVTSSSTRGMWGFSLITV